MTDLHARMNQDRYIRDSARALIEADIANLRNDFSSKGLAARAKDRLSEGATDVYDEAVGAAADNKGALAAIIAALIMWFARNPIAELFSHDSREEDDTQDAGPGENATSAPETGADQ